jgi:mannitol/fructose-specific phosphotransferase system IIA component (Ntr-type)
MPLADLFVRTAIIDRGPLLGKAELVGSLLERLAEAGHVPQAEVPSIWDAVMRRERLGSTGIGNGLAVPHARHPAVTRPLGLLAVCRHPLWFDALDREPADLVALCLFPPDRPGQHLGEASRRSEGVFRRLADEAFRRLADEAFCRRLRQAVSAEEVMEVVQQEDSMTRREWKTCVDPAVMFRLLQNRGLASERKARLFGVACCRWHWDRLADKARRAVEVAERYADGLAFGEELNIARRAFTATLGEGSGPSIVVSYLMGEARPDPVGYALDISGVAAQAGMDQATQTDIIRCLFASPPLRPVEIRPEWLAYGDRVVAKLARGIRGERAFDRMPILADALEEAGCTDAEMLGHLGGPGPHWLGCWALEGLAADE